MPGLSDLARIVRECHEQYTYVSDEDKYGQVERWADHSADVIGGRAWTGDCEDWAITCLGMMMLEGFQKDKCGLAYVTIRDQGHAVVWYEAPTGELFYADCNSKAVHLAKDNTMTWISYMRMSSPTQWLAFES